MKRPQILFVLTNENARDASSIDWLGDVVNRKAITLYLLACHII